MGRLVKGKQSFMSKVFKYERLEISKDIQKIYIYGQEESEHLWQKNYRSNNN